jgi:hypothetical protein
MPLAVDCPACTGPLLFDPSLFGQPIQCPACGHTFTVEAPDSGAPITVQPPRQSGVELATAPAHVDPPAEEDEPFEPRPPRPAPARRMDLRSADWERVRGGFDVILWSSIGITILVGVCFWLAFSVASPDDNPKPGRQRTRRDIEAARESSRKQLKGIAGVEGAIVLVGLVFVFGQIRLCGVPRQGGRWWCVAGTVVNLLGLLLMAGQLYFFYQSLEEFGPEPDAESTYRFLSWTFLGALCAGVVCWYLFLYSFHHSHGRSALGGMDLGALVCTLGYLALLGTLALVFEGSPPEAEVAYLIRIGLVAGALLLVGLYFGTLLTARALVQEA